jgi:translocation and assembly module TamB
VKHGVLRAIRIVAVVLASVAVLAAVLVGGVLTAARTSWGAERIRRLALPRVNAALAGRVDARRLGFFGDRVFVDDVTLRDPDGELVASIARVDIVFSPMALLHRRLELRAIALDEPSLSLRQDQDGETNLSRALAARGDAASPRARPATENKNDDKNDKASSSSRSAR